MSNLKFGRFLLNENTGNNPTNILNHNINLIILFSIMLIVVVILFIIINFIIKSIRRSNFYKKYKVKIPIYFNIKKNNGEHNRKYELNFPKWLYSNKDGSKNKVRKNNRLVYNECQLLFDDYCITNKSPIEMVELVKKIRLELGEDSIPKNVQEIEKYNTLEKNLELFKSMNDIQSVIDSFREEPSKFEEYCGHLYSSMGYEVDVTPKTNDGGYDLILHQNKEKIIVECKCYALRHSIGRPLIQKIVGANQVAQADKIIFITTSDFSKEAREYAKTMDVELIDGEELIKLIKKYFGDSEKNINISKDDWELNKEDILEYYPNDYLDFFSLN